MQKIVVNFNNEVCDLVSIFPELEISFYLSRQLALIDQQRGFVCFCILKMNPIYTWVSSHNSIDLVIALNLFREDLF